MQIQESSTKPSLLLLASESVRFGVENFEFYCQAGSIVTKTDNPKLIIVIPGFTGPESSTAPLREVLSDAGHHAYGWDQGTNLGVSEEIMADTLRHIERLADKHEMKAILIGHSMGGIYARELSKLSNRVESVICLGSPVSLKYGDTHGGKLYNMINAEAMRAAGFEDAKESVAEAPPVPCTMVYSMEDGIVHWPASQQHNRMGKTENIQITGSHCGMLTSIHALKIINEKISAS